MILQVKSHKTELFSYPAFPTIRWTTYSIDCALSDSLSEDQASLCSLSLLILFLLRTLFFPFALGKAEPISLNSPVLFADWKGLPRPRGRVAARATVRQAGRAPAVWSCQSRQAAADKTASQACWSWGAGGERLSISITEGQSWNIISDGALSVPRL